jgi:putative hemolysin
VGNIYDEYDDEEKAEEESDILKIEENVWRVAGSAELEKLADTIGFELPENAEFSTLGGMIMNELSEIPEDGETEIEVDTCGLHIKVEKIEDRRIEFAVVAKHETNDK